MNVAGQNPTLDSLCINTIRGLSIDAVQKANSGHPGLPLGAAPMAYALWSRHLKHSPKNPKWFDRDRFVLSAGHGSMLLYSLVHLTGYPLGLEDLKQFRQLHSKTPGHPENTETVGVEMATGPLGQGLAHAVGMAIAEKFLANRYNRQGATVIDHHTYAIVSDGDLMEGISSEAGSLAGHLKLGKLIFLYDDNGISIDGSTTLAFTEDVALRFEAFGWHIQRVDGMDVDAVDAAITAAKAVSDKPSMILCKTVIGFGSPNKAGSQKVHGSPLGPDELKLTKEALGIPLEPAFYVPDEVNAWRSSSVEAGVLGESAWAEQLVALKENDPQAHAELLKAISGEWGEDWLNAIPVLEKTAATRKLGEEVFNAIAAHIPTLLGGSADLAESTFTHVHGGGSFQDATPAGRNLNFGVREHAMAAACNGIQLHGGATAIASSFLMFTDYCRPSIRLAALMHCPSLFVFTHDSVGLGEDGPTHQPIEHLASLRAIPNLNTFRPCDGYETAAAYKVALQSKETPTMIVLSRQALPPVSEKYNLGHPSEKGGYIVREASNEAKVALVASGSEVQLALRAADVLEARGVATRVVSLPSWFLFEKQSAEYRESVLSKSIQTVSVEAATSFGWARYAQAFVAIDRFGLSAPADQIFAELGFTPENVANVAESLLNS